MQPLVPPPVELILVVDVSGSMRQYTEQAKQYCRAVVDTALAKSPRLRCGLLAFNTECSVLSTLTNRRDNLLSAIGRLASSGGTNFYSALHVCSGWLETQARPGSQRVILFQTDGADGGSSTHAQQWADRIRHTQHATLIGIAVGDGAQSALLHRMCTRVVTSRDYNALVLEAVAIAESAVNATG